jgi:hypothetical protein
MMSLDFEQALYIELTSVTGIGEVFPLNVIEGTKAPYCVYESSIGMEEKTLDGYTSSMEMDCTLYIIQSSYAELKQVSRNVLDLLKSFQSRKIGDPDDGVMVYDFSYENIKELYDPETFLYQNTIGFTVRI